MDDVYEEVEPSPPPVRRPEKNVLVFKTDWSLSAFPDQIFDGKLGPLPLLLTVNVGYDPEESDPFMYHYESSEIMFAYKKAAQKRVLLTDSYRRTLSLPLHSDLLFRLEMEKGSEDLTMAQIVSSRKLPVPQVQFARAECIRFRVHESEVSHHFFGSFKVTSVYEEPYLWCLDVCGNGKIKDKPIVLPWNLMEVSFCRVSGVRGANDPSAKVEEFVQAFSQAAEQLQFEGDPFFQELAFVSQGPYPVTSVKPYIDEHTFITIRFEHSSEEAPPPPPPPRSPINQGPSSTSETQKNSTYYSSVSDRNPQEHMYSEVVEHNIKPQISAVKPVMKPHKDTGSSVEKGGRGALPPPGRSTPTQKGDRKADLMASGDSPSRAVSSHLAGLSVEDVAIKLKELGLGKYARKFRKNHIDGVLLHWMTDDLMAEFNMSSMEFVLLKTFITDGHIPQMSKSKKGHRS